MNVVKKKKKKWNNPQEIRLRRGKNKRKDESGSVESENQTFQIYITPPKKPRNGICKTYVIICWHSGWIFSVSFNIWRKNARARAVPSGLLYWKFSSFGQQYLQSFQKNLYAGRRAYQHRCITRACNTGVNITGEDAIRNSIERAN